MRILLPALLTFAAGLVFGFSGGQRWPSPPMTLQDPDLAAYESGLAAAVDLDQDQRQDLRVLLTYYSRQRQLIYDASRSLLEPDLAELDRRFEHLIRTAILDPEQRQTAARLEMPQALLSAGGGPR
ncbi:MAG: hypothetical protein ISR76_00390 [Planctomycetes bacterium]|nr:hypothetical protein [Planctomycetota bacterium]MBL7007429.1 hypothetical protein [Planctomycetota bacterium]